jgi:hypothetical protein
MSGSANVLCFMEYTNHYLLFIGSIYHGRLEKCVGHSSDTLTFFAITFMSTPAISLNQHGTITTGGGNGYAGGFSFNMTRNGVFNYTVLGDDTFSVYILNQENYERFSHNESFGYIEDLSIENITHANESGNLHAGEYDLMFWCHGQNNVTILGSGETYPSNGLAIPWSGIGLISITTIVSVFATYLVMKNKMRKG